jgi:transcriptional regulator with XRE-family HTH domain
MSLPDNILRRREALDISQQKLAELSGLAIGTIRNAEAGQNLTVPTLTAIARGLGCTAADLLTVMDRPEVV